MNVYGIIINGEGYTVYADTLEQAQLALVKRTGVAVEDQTPVIY